MRVQRQNTMREDFDQPGVIGSADLRYEAVVVAAFPIVLTAGIMLIPVVPDYSNHALAGRAASQAGRWFAGHALSAIAFGLAVASASVLSRRIALAGASRQARIALPLVAVGSALHAAGLGADGVGPLAAVAGSGDSGVFFDGSARWVPPLFIAGAAAFGAGQLLLVHGFRRIVGPRLARWLLGAAVAFSAAEALPSGWGLYAVAAFALMLYGPISRTLWREAATTARQPAA